MDFISHALWGGAAFGRSGKRFYIWATVISVLPDILTEGLFMVLYLLNIGGMPGWENGHPNITEFPMFAQYLYSFTHSIVVFVAIFLLLAVIFKKPIWIIAGWGLHILIDIPTHSLALFPTPFLWPISEYRFDGIGWDNPIILTVDILLLITIYSVWLYPKLKARHRTNSIV